MLEVGCGVSKKSGHFLLRDIGIQFMYIAALYMESNTGFPR